MPEPTTPGCTVWRFKKKHGCFTRNARNIGAVGLTPQHNVISYRVQDKPGEKCKHGTLSNHSSSNSRLVSGVVGGLDGAKQCLAEEEGRALSKQG